MNSGTFAAIKVNSKENKVELQWMTDQYGTLKATNEKKRGRDDEWDVSDDEDEGKGKSPKKKKKEKKKEKKNTPMKKEKKEKKNTPAQKGKITKGKAKKVEEDEEEWE